MMIVNDQSLDSGMAMVDKPSDSRADSTQLRILYLTHYFPPEVNAPAVRVSELATEWRRLGHQVDGSAYQPRSAPRKAETDAVEGPHALGGIPLVQRTDAADDSCRS